MPVSGDAVWLVPPFPSGDWGAVSKGPGVCPILAGNAWSGEIHG